MSGELAAARTLTEVLLEGARHGDKTCFALVSAADSRIESRLTFADAIDTARRAAGALSAAGLERGGRALIAAEPSASWITSFMGALFAGGVAVPANHRYRQRELGMLIKASEPSVLVVDTRSHADAAAAVDATGSHAQLIHIEHDGLADAAPVAPVEVDPTELAVILHTSGTTGVPKGVERTHGDYANFTRIWSSRQMDEGERVLNFLPLYHQAGLVCSFLSAFRLGAPTFQIDRFDRDTFWSTVDAHGLTWGILMQPVPRYLLEDAAGRPVGSHALRWIVATLNQEDWVSFQAQFGVSVHSSYGSTESTIAWITGSRKDGPVDRERIYGPLGGALCGRPIEDWVDLRLVADDGPEIVEPNRPGFIEIRGGGVFRSYFQNPAVTADVFDEDGWFRTGDYGYFAPSAELYFLNRVSGLIRRSGENIAPREIEELLEEHPAVAEAAVVGVEDSLRGEEIAAFVVPRDQALTEDELFDFCRERLASFKVPRYMEFRSELPHTPTFKVRLDALGLSSAAVDRRTRGQAESAVDAAPGGSA